MRQVRIGFRDPFQDQKLQPSDSPSAIRRSTHGGQQLRRRGGAEQPVPTLWVEAALAADRRRRQPLEPSRHSISPAAKALEDRRRNHDMMRSHGVRRIGRAMPSIRLALLSSSARRRCLRITNLAWKWSGTLWNQRWRAWRGVAKEAAQSGTVHSGPTFIPANFFLPLRTLPRWLKETVDHL
jgi:hypothetical protein